jgi:hypothetical protein
MIIILFKGWILSYLETMVSPVLEYLKKQGCIKKILKEKKSRGQLGYKPTTTPEVLHRKKSAVPSWAPGLNWAFNPRMNKSCIRPKNK